MLYVSRHSELWWSTHGSGVTGIRHLGTEIFPALIMKAFADAGEFGMRRAELTLRYMGAFDEIVAVRFEQTNRERTAHRVEGYRAHGGPWVGSVCERVRSTGAVFAHHTSRAPNSNNRVLSAS